MARRYGRIFVCWVYAQICALKITGLTLEEGVIKRAIVLAQMPEVPKLL